MSSYTLTKSCFIWYKRKFLVSSTFLNLLHSRVACSTTVVFKILIDSLFWILNILWVTDLSLILFNTSLRIYSLPKESKYIAIFLSINSKTQKFLYYFYHPDLWYAPSLF